METKSGLRRGLAVAAAALGLAAAAGPAAAGSARAASPAWRVSHVFTGQPLANLLAVTATGPAGAWAFGDGKNSRPAAVHWDGKTWSTSYLPHATDRPDQVSETGRTNVWAAGGGCGQVNTTPYVSRWNGSAWTTTLFPKAPACGVSAVVTTGPSDGWLFNEGGSPTVALHFTGKTWKKVSLGSAGTVLSAAAVSGKVWAVTYTSKDHMLIVRWNGSTWHTVRVPAAPVPKAGDHTYPIQLVAAGTHNIWVTTNIVRNNTEVPGPLRSLVLQRDGTGWHWLKVPFADLALQAASDGHGGMWASALVNSPSTAYDFVHYSGGTWTRQPAPTAGIPPTISTVDVFSLALIPGTRTLWASGDAFWDTGTGSGSASVIFKYGP